MSTGGLNFNKHKILWRWIVQLTQRVSQPNRIHAYQSVQHIISGEERRLALDVDNNQFWKCQRIPSHSSCLLLQTCHHHHHPRSSYNWLNTRWLKEISLKRRPYNNSRSISSYSTFQTEYSAVDNTKYYKAKMSAQLISGTEVSKEIQQQLAEEVTRMKEIDPNFLPGLAIVQVGGREDSNVYIRMKIKAATTIGMKAEHVKLPRTITEIELLEELDKLNKDPNIHGIIVQMPLDADNPIDSHRVTDAVDASKDVDGLCTVNEGRVAIGDLKSGFMPCTPYGCIELIKRTGVPIQGAKAVVLGRSKIVGTPVAELLKWHDATVTVCHSKTKNLADEVRQADIVVVGIGKPELVKGSWVKPGAVVIDCGINSIPDPTKKSGQRLVGDVDFAEVSQVAGYITPVPGGVGPMTVCMLMKNTVISAGKSLALQKGIKWNFSPIPLKTATPVPR